MKSKSQNLEELLKQIESMPPVDLSMFNGPITNDVESVKEENLQSNDIRSILIEQQIQEKKKDKKDEDEKEEQITPDSSDIQAIEPPTTNPLVIEPKSLKTANMRKRIGDLIPRVPEGVKSVTGANRMPMASSQIDQILSGMMAQPSIIARQRANLTNSYKPFANQEQSILSENLKAKVAAILNKPKHQKEINKMKKEISGNNDNSRNL